MPLVLALDQGTTSSRAIVFDQGGSARGVAQAEFRQIFPQPGWVEHDATEIWATQSGVMYEALAKAGVAARDVAAIGITNQRETTVVWERASGRPIANAIVWQDRRTAPMCDELRAAGHAPTFAAKTGLVLDAYFSGTKLRWLLDEVRGARRRAELAFGTVDTWLLWKLTGGRVHATEPSNASRTLLYDLRRRHFDDRLLEWLGVPRAVLPEVRPSCGLFGTCERRHLGAELPITGILGDQQAALFGQGCFEPGTAKCTLGTGAFLLMNTGAKPRRSRHGLLTTIAWQRGDSIRYALEGSVFVAGAAVQWLRDGFGLIERSAEIERLAASVPDSGGVVFVPAFVGLGAPHWDMAARGAILGLTRGTTKAHLARATLEAIAFQVADVVECMESDAGVRVRELRVDGGAARDDLLCQLVADACGRPVVRPTQVEMTASGAAFLAGLAVGFWKDAREIASLARVDRRFEPRGRPAERAEQRRRWRDAVRRVRSDR